MDSILLLDIGSIQTKALLLTHDKGKGKWPVISCSRVPTTIDYPENDAMVGIMKAVSELREGKIGMELSLSEFAETIKICGSAGGGLQMIVLGVVKNMTAESAKRAALGSGAIVTQVVSGGNVLKQPERLKQLQSSRPDIILLAGGTDGGNKNQVIDLAETIHAAQVKSRWNDQLAPVVYAGNEEVREGIKAYLQNKIDLRITKNIRPDLEVEKIDNVNLEIQDLYMKNVVQNIPGLEQLRDANYELKPTAVGLRKLVDIWGKSKSNNAILFDVGGLTTDSYSSIEYVRREYKQPSGSSRPISGNMGYVRERKVFSAINASAGLGFGATRLLKESGITNICRWLEKCDTRKIFNDCFNRVISPLTTSETDVDLSRALTAEALSTTFIEHQKIAEKLHGVSVTRHITETFNQISHSSGTLAEWKLLDDIILTGGVFTKLSQEMSLQIANDALQPSGITNIFLDKKDILSQLATMDVKFLESSIKFVNELLIPLATIIAPISNSKKGKYLAIITLSYDDGSKKTINLKSGDLIFINDMNGTVEININPSSTVDFGDGPGAKIDCNISRATMGIILDGRRPINQGFSYNDIEKWYGKNYSNLTRGERNVK